MTAFKPAKMQRANLKPWKLADVVDGWKLRVQLSAAAQDLRGNNDALRTRALNLLKGALFRGRLIAQERLEAGAGGLDCAELLAAVQDEVLSALYDFTITHIFRVHNRTQLERVGICATGGYGRFALAPSSDVDLLFIRPSKDASWAESVIEYILYMLWDMGLKVGHASRTIPECLKAAKEDFTIRTAVLETRYICGDEALVTELNTRLRNEIFQNTGAEFVSAKLQERNQRHIRAGESRYMVEPNIKDGKGGLRDLHTMFWIAKYLHNIGDTIEYVEKGIFTKEQMHSFDNAIEFLWTVRCHLHFLTGRPEERLTFDLQPEMARLMGYGDRADNPAVERFMKHYFLVTKEVGSLTRILSAKLESDFLKKEPRGIGRFFGSRAKPMQDKRFVVETGRIGFADLKAAQNDVVQILSLFLEAHKADLDIDPNAMALVTEFATKNVGLSKNPIAKKLFLEIMEVQNGPARLLVLMNETGLLGRIVPEFGRIVGQTQFNMYHHFTVDEHTLRAVQILGDIESGQLAKEVPVATGIFPRITSRRALYLAMLLHDVGKGEGDQQILGSKAAKTVCKRLELSDDETELVAWLVGHHLIMSDCAQKRDLGDPQTIARFAQQVENLEQLRLLLILTVADIRAVGPGIWNDWKAQLLRDLYKLSEAILRGGRGDEEFVKSILASQIIEAKKTIINDAEIGPWYSHLDDAYWLGVDEGQQIWHQEEVRKFLKSGAKFWVASRLSPNRGATEILVISDDKVGLFANLANIFANNSANVIDARIFTNSNGQAFDTFAILGPSGDAFGVDQKRTMDRLINDISISLRDGTNNKKQIETKPTKRLSAFQVQPFVVIDNEASNLDTVVEISGLDRAGLLADLAEIFNEESLNITSAHIAGVGERATDAFYVRSRAGLKLVEPKQIERLKQNIEQVLSQYQLAAPTIVSKRKLAQARSSLRR